MDTRDTRDIRAVPPERVAGRDAWADTPPVRDVRDVRPAADRGAAGDDRSLTDLLKELRDETTTLVRQELALAKTEMKEKASEAGRHAMSIGVGAVLAYLGLLFVLLGASVGLAILLVWTGMEVHGWWLGPLIVGVVVGVIGAIMTRSGISAMKKQSLTPERTVQSLQEDKQWLQEKVTK